KTHDGENDVGLLGDLLGRVRPGGPLLQEWLGLVLGAVVNRGLVALGEQVLAHPSAHDAGADPADARLAAVCLGDRHVGVSSGRMSGAAEYRRSRFLLRVAAGLASAFRDRLQFSRIPCVAPRGSNDATRQAP